MFDRASIKSLTGDQLAALSREVAEEVRFRAAISRSTAAVQAVVMLFHRWGWAAKAVAEADFVDRQAFKDAGADVICCRFISGPWKLCEVKHRTFEFSSVETFPFDTIIIDRATKGTVLDLYFNVNRSMTHCAIVDRASQHSWKEVTIYDKTRGYHSTNFECPKGLALFRSMKHLKT